MTDMGLLARQLSQLGRDLEDEIAILGEMELAAVEAEGKYRHYKELHEDALAGVMLKSRQGSAESRKAEARVSCIDSRIEMEQANISLDRAKALLRVKYASISALGRRIDIGRSLLSREKALMSSEMGP
jgi:hypothetical protein